MPIRKKIAIGIRKTGGKSACAYGGNKKARKMASAMIAKIPTALSRHIGATYFPR